MSNQMKELIKSKGLSPTAIAAYGNFPVTSIYSLLNHRSRLTKGMCECLSYILKIPPHQFEETYKKSRDDYLASIESVREKL